MQTQKPNYPPLSLISILARLISSLLDSSLAQLENLQHIENSTRTLVEINNEILLLTRGYK